MSAPGPSIVSAPPGPPQQPAAAGASGGGGGGGDLISANTVAWAGAGSGGDGDREECNICLTDQDGSSLSLSQCGHTYHRACLQQLINSSAREFLQCPTCKKVYGVKTGTMPTSGTISHRLLPNKLAGYESAPGCIEITFRFSGGVQGPEHPSPGQPYSASNFPRTAFLPGLHNIFCIFANIFVLLSDTVEGEQALHGVYLAWTQRLMFTVGRSITTGRENCVTWNDIHMKTNVRFIC